MEIWCTDEQARHVGMKMLLEEAENVRSLYETSVFLVIPSIDVVLLVCHADTLLLTALQERIRKACDLTAKHPVTLEHMTGGGELTGVTLRDAGLRAGDSVRVLL